MAARTRVDSTVSERRLRPIYDCLDYGNNKKALQEAEKVLRKQKDFHCAKVLKSLALLRLGRQLEACKLLEEVRCEVPVDDATLQAMTICYRELHKPQLIADVYKAATQREPQSEELLTHLFMAHVRLGEYKKQQQVALALYKLKAKNPYYFWAIMSIVMQAHIADELVGKMLLLPLAERMAAKFVDENKMEAEAEVHLYLMILELQGKYDSALSVLESPLGDKLTSFLNFKVTKKAELCKKLQRWSETNAAYRKLLLESPDNWSFYQEYFHSAMKLMESNWRPGESDTLQVDGTVDLLMDFIKDRVQNEEAKEKGALRGPFLANISLIDVLKHCPTPVDVNGKKVALLRDYFVRFGDKTCCFSDMKILLKNLEPSEKQELINECMRCLQLAHPLVSTPCATNVKDMQRYLLFVQLSRYLGLHAKLSNAEKCQLSVELLDHYHNGLAFGRELLSTDIQPSDPFCLIAVHLLVTVWKDTGCDEAILHKILIVLENALLNSPSNFQLKLLLCKMYNTIGAVSSSYALYESLDVKHVQLDTLGYLITRHIAAKGIYSTAGFVFGQVLKFFLSHYKDTVDYLISSYKFGSFTKIHEFVRFQERLNNSLQYMLVTVDRRILDLILESNSHQSSLEFIPSLDIIPESDGIVWEDICDNRDLDIMISWDPPESSVHEEMKTESFESEIAWLKYRSYLVRAIGAVYFIATKQCTSPSDHSDGNMSNGERKSDLEVLKLLIDQLKELSCSKAFTSDTPRIITLQAPEPSRVFSYSRGPYFLTIIQFLDLFFDLQQLTEQNVASENNCQERMRNEFVTQIKGCIADITERMKGDKLTELVFMGDFLEDLTNVAEMLSFVAIVAGFCQQLLKPVTVTSAKKTRKKKDRESKATDKSQLVESYDAMVTGLHEAAVTFSDAIENLQQELHQTSNKKSLVEEFQQLTLKSALFTNNTQEELQDEVDKKIYKSYLQSLQEIGVLAVNKVKYFSALKL